MSLLDNIFASAAQLHNPNTTVTLSAVVVTIDRGGLGTNEPSTIATYAEAANGAGQLTYAPSGHETGRVPIFYGASFTGTQFKRYFSNDRYGGSGLLTGEFPFNAPQAIPLSLTIRDNIRPAEPLGYVVSLKSGTDLNGTFSPTIDPTTGILTGTLGTKFIAVSLYGLASFTPPK